MTRLKTVIFFFFLLSVEKSENISNYTIIKIVIALSTNTKN